MGAAASRFILIEIGRARVRARLFETPTAHRIWQVLPIYSSAHVWGQEVHFETEAESGRERGARMLVKPGEIAFIPQEDWIAIAFGPTPISRKGEVRLGSPANIFAEALDDVTAFAGVRPGERVAVTAAQPPEPE
jgi:hypothetical protein